MSIRRRRKLGEILVEEGFISSGVLEKALETQKSASRHVPLGRLLVDQGHITNEQLVTALSIQLGYPSVILDKIDNDVLQRTAQKIPDTICRRYQCVAFQEDEEFLHIAMVDPNDLEARDRIERVIEKKPKYYIAIEDEVTRIVNELHAGKIQTEELVSSLDLELSEEDDDEMVEDVPVARFIREILERAVKENVTDIHIEPQENRTVIRFRIDGVLHTIAEPPKASHGSIVSKVKLLAGLDIAQRLIPQDGRIKYLVSNKPVDIRVSTLPAIHGEKAVLRILDQSKGVVNMANLGLDDEDLERLQALIRQPYGLIIVCGPTGSGKTTTLYSFLHEINRPEINIISLEDPVEYHLDGITQVQVQERRDERSSLTFARGLRSVLRQDPDVILVGETRDAETAHLSIQASLTGHLVFTTLHTNDSTGSISRLINMGIQPFMVSSALIGVIAQRLVRRICSRCKEPYEPNENERRILGIENGEDIVLYRGQGCSSCSKTGYKGRIPAFEILIVDEQLRRMIARGDDDKKIRDFAIKELGLVTLSQYGINLVKKGITTVPEIVRTVYAIK